MKIKSKKKNKWLRISLAVVLLAIALLWSGGLYLSRKYENILRSQISQRLPESLKVNFSSLKINLFARSLEMRDLEIIFTPAISQCQPNSLSISGITLRGIHLTDLIYNKIITVNRARIRNSRAILYQNCFNRTDSGAINLFESKSVPSLSAININIFDLENFHITYYNDSAVVAEAIVNSSITDLHLPLQKDTFSIRETGIGDITLAMAGIRWSPDSSAYITNVKEFRIDSKKGTLSLDSLSIIPRYKKFEFSQRLGKQTDRFEVTIPKIVLNNIIVKKLADSIVNASGLHIYSAELKAFRDKRLPFIKDHETAIPSAMIQKIPFSFSIDSVCIHDATVAYEEFPEKTEGDQSGSIWFNDLNATAYNVANQPIEGGPDFIDLDVETKFMNSGILSVSFDIPFDPSKLHRVTGSLRNFELTSMNPTLKNLAMIQVHSGTMNWMPFTFTYSDRESNGEVELYYEKLKVVSLQEKKEVIGINELKTFLLNIFLRNKKDESLPKDKRSGVIHVERDKKRSIFNYLWKSVFSGIKNSYNLENILPDNKELKKKKGKKKDQPGNEPV